MDFAVRVLNEKGEPGEGKWVLTVDAAGERLLIGGEDNRLRWVKMSEVVVFTVANPDIPRPVVPIQPQQPITLGGAVAPLLQKLNGR